MTTVSHNSTTPSVSVTTASGNNPPQLVATPVPDEQRISFWPQHFGLLFIRNNLMTTVSHNSTTPSVSVTTASGNNPPQLVATPVPDEQRISFWPQHFGLIPQWVTLEPRVFGWMDRLCEDYCGGIWNLYTLNNGGAFMAPEPDDDDDETWVLFNAMNGNRAEMSPEAAGIAACLMAYSHHACRTENYAMTVHYYRLRDYALQHPECSAIMRIID